MDRIRLLLLACFLSIAANISAKDIYVVCVGISNYESIQSLKLPQEDAKAVAELYRAHSDNVSIITGRFATRTTVLNECRSMFSKAREDDMVVLFFSGHGLEGGLCPYDIKADGTNAILYQDVQKIMSTSDAAQKIIIADACFSGGLRVNDVKGKSNNYSNVILFLSSRNGETSQESLFMKNGIFTTYLLRGLRGAADTDRDRKISAKELFSFVSENVKKKTGDQQHPVMWGNFDDELIFMQW